MQKVKLAATLLLTIYYFVLPPAAFSDISKANITPNKDSNILQAMEKELKRSFSKLKNVGPAPVYFLAYRLYDKQSLSLSASYGGIEDTPEVYRNRYLNIELRAGSPQLDSTHRLRTRTPSFYPNWQDSASVPVEDNEDALRALLWNKTDAEFKNAQKTYKEVVSNKDVLVTEEDLSEDFSKEKPQVFKGGESQFKVDVNVWQDRLRRASTIYKQHPKITDSTVILTADKIRRYLVNSEGTKIEDERIHYEVSTIASALADDGMRIWLYDYTDALNPNELPDENQIKEMVEKLAKSVEQLRDARPAEPYVGPVILRAKAAGVFFHEIFGHRAEGHRQKDEEEGRTFTKMIGKKIMPEFISVYDDPTKRQLGSPKNPGKLLNGYYRFDDEGIPAQKVTLVDHGTLKNFLMGRSPIKGFNFSNGHGRSSPGEEPVARQGNLIIESSKQVPYNQLRRLLIAEAKKQGKPYGLVFDELAGGFTLTQDWMPQTFKLLPLRVYRVYTDGRPDELLRGVSIIGTPLTCLEKIVSAANDTDTFNGNCGAESGSVPVSASSPSLLIQTLEIERQHKQQDKPPLLPPPAKKAN